MVDGTVSIGEFGSRDEAHLVAGLLQSHDIDAYARLEDAGGAYPQLAAQVRGGTAVHVPAEQAARARTVLADWAADRAEVPTGAPSGIPDADPDDEWADAEVLRDSGRARRIGWMIITLLWLLPIAAGLLLNVTGAWG